MRNILEPELAMWRNILADIFAKFWFSTIPGYKSHLKEDFAIKLWTIKIRIVCLPFAVLVIVHVGRRQRFIIAIWISLLKLQMETIQTDLNVMNRNANGIQPSSLRFKTILCRFEAAWVKWRLIRRQNSFKTFDWTYPVTTMRMLLTLVAV